MEKTKSQAAKLTKAWKKASETCEERWQATGSQGLVQFIAYWQMVSASISSILVIVMFMYGAWLIVMFTEVSSQTLEEELINFKLGNILGSSTGLLIILWTSTVGYATDTILQLWASHHLLHSTENEISNTDALKCIRFWWTFTVISTVMWSLIFIASRYYGIAFLFLIFRLSFLFHVRAFRMTIERKWMAARAAFKKGGNPSEVFIAPK